MPSRPQANRCRPVPCAGVLCAGLLAGALMPGAAHAAGVRDHRHISSQIIGGSRDQRGFTVGDGSHGQIIGGSRDQRGSTVSPTRAAASVPRGKRQNSEYKAIIRPISPCQATPHIT